MSTGADEQSARRIRVAIVDDDALVRAGLTAILGSAPDLDVVGEASDGDSVPELVARHRPDVVVMDVRMPRVDGIEATRRLRSAGDAGSSPRVLILTTFHLDAHVFEAIEAGASGFTLKDASPRELVDAVRVVASGEAMLSPADTRAVIDRYSGAGRQARRGAARAALAQLSPRELEVVEAVAQGLSNREIGSRLFCSEATVKTHLTHVFAKLGDANRVRLALLIRDAE